MLLHQCWSKRPAVAGDSGGKTAMHPQTFDEYWLGYLGGHSKPATRFVHYIGLFFAPLAGIAASFLLAWWAFLIIIPVLLRRRVADPPASRAQQQQAVCRPAAVERHCLAEDVGARPDRRPRSADQQIGPDRSRTAAMTTAVVVVCIAILGAGCGFPFLLGPGRAYRQWRFASAS